MGEIPTSNIWKPLLVKKARLVH